MAEERRNALERMVEAFKMVDGVPDGIDFDDADTQAFIDSMPESRKNMFLTMAKDPGVKKMNAPFSAAMGQYLTW